MSLPIGWGRPTGFAARLFALAVALLASMLTIPAVTAQELREVPKPGSETERLSEQDRDQLVQQHEVIDRLRAAGDEVSNTRLANAYGRLGQLYYAFDLLHSARIAFANAAILDPEQYGWHYYLAAMHMADGELEEALGKLQRVLELQPDDLPSLVRKGRVLLGLGRIDEAETAFAVALELDSESAAAHEGLGEVRYEQDRLQEAIERFERAMELQPEASSLHHKLGLAHRKAGNMDKAREHLVQNRSDEVSFPDPLIAVLDRFVHGSRPHVKAGNLAMAQGEVERAAEHYRQAVEADPEDALSRYNLGFVLARLGHREEAQEQLREAIELDLDYRNAHYNLAASLAEEGKWEEAAHHYGRAVEIDPEDHEARLEWAGALAAAGSTDRAVQELEALLDAAADYDTEARAGAHVRLARLAASRGDVERALEHYRQGTEIAPRNVEVLQARAVFLARRGRYSEAAELFDRAVELVPDESPHRASEQLPDQVELRFARAMALLLGDLDARARETLEGDLSELGGTKEALPLAHLLARVLATSEDPAVRDGRRALELALEVFRAQESVDHGATVAMAWAEIGDFRKAVNWARQVVTVAEQRGRPEASIRARRYLELFEAGRPVREPWDEERGWG